MTEPGRDLQQDKKTDMAEPPRHPKTDDETFVGQDREPGMPRWLSAVVVCFVVLVVLVMVVLHLTGTLGPGSH